MIVIVARVYGPAVAGLLQARFEAEGIALFALDGHTGVVNPILTKAGGGMRLAVLAKDLEAARAIIADIHPVHETPWPIWIKLTVLLLSLTVGVMPITHNCLFPQPFRRVAVAGADKV